MARRSNSTALARRPDGNPARTAHYEQLGLFLAEQAASLIAVQDLGAAQGRTGGTGRVLDYRLTGQLDAISADVVARSRELAEPPKLADPRVGPAWLVDLASLGNGDGESWFRVLLPPDDPAVQDPGLGPLARSLEAAAWLRKVNDDAATLSEDDWRRVDREAPAGGGAVDLVRRARRIMTSSSATKRRT